MEKKYKTLTINTIIYAIGSFGSKFITFFLVPFYTVFLTTEQYGIANLALNFSNILIPIASLMIQDALLRFTLEDKENKYVLLANSFFVYIIGFLIILSLMPLLNFYTALASYKWYIFLFAIVNGAENILCSYCRAIDKNKLYSLAGLIQTIFMIGTNIVLIAVLKLGVEGFLIGNIISHCVILLFLFFTTKAYKVFKFGKLDFEYIKPMIKFSLPLIFNQISWWVLNSSDNIMIEAFIGADSLGLYTAGAKIPNLLMIITSVFSLAWAESSIKEYDKERNTSFYENIFKYFSLVMFGGSIFLITICKFFASIYLQGDFSNGWYCIPFLIGAVVFHSISNFYEAIYQSTKHNFPITITTIIAAGINVTINLFFLKKFGIIVASISTFVSYFVTCIIRMFHTRKYFIFKVDFLRFFLNCILILALIFVSIYDFYIYLFGVLTLILFIAINFSSFKDIFKNMKKIFKRN